MEPKVAQSTPGVHEVVRLFRSAGEMMQGARVLAKVWSAKWWNLRRNTKAQVLGCGVLCGVLCGRVWFCSGQQVWVPGMYALLGS